ncbi:hypothetical protein HPHPH21_0794 [Helicobacter pylori Hp H-21]|nr:hypothetical protein HPHPH21_0794 [Helicobacter pylori Hp H-21]
MSAQNPQFSNNTLTIIEKPNNGVKLRLAVGDLGNGNKNFYSGRNFKDFRDANLHSGNHPMKIILHKKI